MNIIISGPCAANRIVLLRPQGCYFLALFYFFWEASGDPGGQICAIRQTIEKGIRKRWVE